MPYAYHREQKSAEDHTSHAGTPERQGVGHVLPYRITRSHSLEDKPGHIRSGCDHNVADKYKSPSVQTASRHFAHNKRRQYKGLNYEAATVKSDKTIQLSGFPC